MRRNVKPPAPKEKSTTEYLKRQLKKAGGWGVKIKGEGVNGVPDYLIACRGLHVAETKRPKGGRLSEIQKWFHEEFGKRSAYVWVLQTREEVDFFIFYVTGLI